MKVKDNRNMEYEARVMIDEQKYLEIKKSFLNKCHNHKEMVNINHYFDNESRYLTEHHMVLRLRNISEKENELTLKIKGENGDLEINYPLTLNQVDKILVNLEFPKCEIIDELIKRGIDISSLKLITILKTERLEFYYPEYTFVVDKNYYNNKVDFNLEVESDSKNAAISYLKSIIPEFGVEYKKDYISKSRRAIYNL